MREGSLEAPTRHPLDWKNPDFYNEEKLLEEMERIFDVLEKVAKTDVSHCATKRKLR